MLDTTGRHPSVAQVARYFASDHLTDQHLRDVARSCEHLAATMLEGLPDGPELTAGLRKLLEAEDCVGRARLDA